MNNNQKTKLIGNTSKYFNINLLNAKIKNKSIIIITKRRKSNNDVNSLYKSCEASRACIVQKKTNQSQ